MKSPKKLDDVLGDFSTRIVGFCLARASWSPTVLDVLTGRQRVLKDYYDALFQPNGDLLFFQAFAFVIVCVVVVVQLVCFPVFDIFDAMLNTVMFQIDETNDGDEASDQTRKNMR